MTTDDVVDDTIMTTTTEPRMAPVTSDAQSTSRILFWRNGNRIFRRIQALVEGFYVSKKSTKVRVMSRATPFFGET
jgi:hypothetical protein